MTLKYMRSGQPNSPAALGSGPDSWLGLERQYKGLMKGLGERSVLTEYRRQVVKDVAGAKRPMNFLGAGSESGQEFGRSKSRHKMTSRLRHLETKAIWWQELRLSVDTFCLKIMRMCLVRNYSDQLRSCVRSAVRSSVRPSIR